MAPGLSQLVQHLRRLVAPREGVPDAVLLDRFVQNREEEAFAALVARHGPMVMRVCERGLSDAAGAEDCFQATFLVLARKAGTLRRPASLASWLHNVALRTAAEARKACRRRRHWQMPFASELPDPHPDPLEQLTARELLMAVDEEVQRLPERYRLPVILCCLENLSQEETARRLGWTPGSVKARLERGRRRLEARLAKRGLTLSAGLAVTAVSGASAAVSPGLRVAVAKTATLFATGLAAKGTESSCTAIVLAEAALKSMSTAKMTIFAVSAIVCAVAISAVSMALQGRSEKPLNSSRQVVSRRLASAKDETPKKPNPATDIYGDPLPSGAIARLGSSRLRPGHPLSSVAFTPDGTKVVSGNWGNSIHVWDAATGKELRRFAGKQRAVRVVCLPDGRTLASVGSYSPGGSDHKIIRLWDLAAGAEIRQLAGHEGTIAALACAPDGKTLASAASDKTVRLWRVATGEHLRRIEHAAEGGCLAWSHDGGTLAFGTRGGHVCLWDVTTGKLLHEMTGHKSDVAQLAWSPNDRLLASGGSDGTVELWDPRTGKERRRLGGGTAQEIQKQIQNLRKKAEGGKEGPSGTGYLGYVNGLAFSHDGKLLYTAGGDNRTIFVFDVATGNELRRLDATHRVFCLAPSADGKQLAVGGPDRIDLWNLETEKLRTPPVGPQGRVDAVAFSPDGQILATAGDDADIRLWEAGTWRELARLPRRDPAVWAVPVAAVRFSPDGKLLVVSGPHQWIVVWDWAAKKEMYRFVDETRGGAGPAVAFSPDGTILAASFHGLTLWEATTGKELGRFDGRDGTAGGGSSIAFSPDGRRLALGSLGKIALYDSRTGKLVQAFEKVEENVVTPTGRKFFNFVTSLAFSRDGKSLLSGAYDGKLRLWETATGRLRHTFEGRESTIYSVALAGDGSYAASASGSIFDHGDNTVRLWNVATGKEMRRFVGHQSVIASIALSPDGRFLASGSEDSTTLIWDTSRVATEARPPLKKLSADDQRSLWADLGHSDAARAFQAMRVLNAAPAETTAVLRKNLRPVAMAQSQQIDQWISDLDSSQFKVRNNASQELDKFLGQAEPALRKRLQGEPSLEARARIQRLLQKLEQEPSGDELRALRAIEVLEHLATSEAQAILRTLASGPATARLTQEARSSLGRLNEKRP